jgi:hypothetical protein
VQFTSCNRIERGEREWSESSAVDGLWLREILQGVNKSNHLTQNLQLLVTEPRVRDNMFCTKTFFFVWISVNISDGKNTEHGKLYRHVVFHSVWPVNFLTLLNAPLAYQSWGQLSSKLRFCTYLKGQVSSKRVPHILSGCLEISLQLWVIGFSQVHMCYAINPYATNTGKILFET